MHHIYSSSWVPYLGGWILQLFRSRPPLSFWMSALVIQASFHQALARFCHRGKYFCSQQCYSVPESSQLEPHRFPLDGSQPGSNGCLCPLKRQIYNTPTQLTAHRNIIWSWKCKFLWFLTVDPTWHYRIAASLHSFAHGLCIIKNLLLVSFEFWSHCFKQRNTNTYNR